MRSVVETVSHLMCKAAPLNDTLFKIKMAYGAAPVALETPKCALPAQMLWSPQEGNGFV